MLLHPLVASLLRLKRRVSVNRSLLKYTVARQNYGMVISSHSQIRLKDRIRWRLFFEHGIKPRVRYKLNTYYNFNKSLNGGDHYLEWR